MQESTALQPPIIALLTDFGNHDGYVGVMKGVILTITTPVHLIDLTHTIPAQHIIDGAWVLKTSYPYFPPGSIFLCVVDPGVGSARRAVALRAGDWTFVGPDNGLFSFILDEQPVHEAVVLLNPAYQRPYVSATFHGRDIFAPAAAYLATGHPLQDLGPHIQQDSLQRLRLPHAQRLENTLNGTIIHIDHFGNLITTIPASLVPDLYHCTSVSLTFMEHPIEVNTVRTTFAPEEESGEPSSHPFIYIDSAGYLGIAIRNGNAAATLGIRTGTAVTMILAS